MKNPKSLFRIGLVTLLLVISSSLVYKFTTEAATLQATYIYLSRISAGLDGTSGKTVEMVLAIDTAQTIPSGGNIKIEFADAEDGTWCRTAGNLTVTPVATSTADLVATNWAIDAVLPTSGTLGANCAKGAGASSVDTITISQVGALTAGTTYGVKLANNTGLLGTHGTAGAHEVTVSAYNGTTVDSKTFKIALVANDTVVVTAAVSEAPTVVCSISSNAINLGTLYPGGTYATGSHTITIETTGLGYYWAAYGEGDGSTDAGLYKNTVTTKLLASGPAATIDLTAAGAEGFGITASAPSGGSVPASFGNGTAGVFGTLDRALAGAKIILYRNGSQSSPVSSTITYGVKAGASAPSGSYTESVTFVCGGYF